MITKKSLLNYAFASYVYTGARKTLQLWDAKVERRIDCEYKKTNMLLGEKLYVFGISMAMSPVLVPVYVYNDLNLIDVYLKRQNPEDYGLAKSVSPFILEEHILR